MTGMDLLNELGNKLINTLLYEMKTKSLLSFN